MKVLLVDDDTDLLDVTAYALRREGFNIIVATDGAQAVRRWESDHPDLVVLDVGLPRVSGFEVCRRIRQGGQTPVILLTALHDDDHVVQGFRLGADDYVTKPFCPRQLAMRIRAVWRRGAGDGRPEPVRELHAGDLTLDVEGHEVKRGEQMVRLTPLEFRILHILASNPGRVVSATRLVEYAWGYDGGDVSLLKTHICHIRKKLLLERGGQGDISAVPGVGYRLTAARTEES
ncbi:MAG: response regulator transcription factor [Chloroflexi bacterium]|nr:response regulator transcription factor [Chloroflexota bacterium]